jgi:type IV pilus assembly protein PilQ
MGETEGDSEAVDEQNEPISDSDISGDDSTASNEVAEDAAEGAADEDEFEEDGTEVADANDSDDSELEDELDDTPDEAPAEDKVAAADELEPAPPEEVQATPAPVPTPEPAEPVPAPQPVVEKAAVRDIKFLNNPGGGTVLIETSKPVSYQTRLNTATQQFVIELADVDLPPGLQRPFNTAGAGSRIGGINAYQSAGSTTARIVVQLAGTGGAEPIVQQEGTSLVIIPPAPPVVAKSAPPMELPVSEDSEAPRKGQSLSARTLDEFLTGNQKFVGRNISLQVKDADVRDVVNFLAEESGANIVMSDDVEGKISLKLRRVPWDQALVTVMRTKGLGYVRQGNVLRISTLKSLQAETEATQRILEAQKNIVPAVVEVIPVSYANIEDLTKTLGAFMSKDGRVVADSRTSTLILTDKGEVVERVRKLIKTLDIPPAQVSIESKIVEAVENFQNFLGVNWNFSGAALNMSPSGGHQGAPIDLTLGMSSATLSRNFQGSNPFNSTLQIGTLDFFGDLTATLTLAERDSLAKVISAPRISAMNREKSTITQEGETVAVISSRNEQTNTVTKQDKKTPYKLELQVTPQITADGGVIMDLKVRREFPGPIEDEETKSRGVNKRSAETKVLVRNGQTAVIGGIYTSDETEASSGVPGLKNLPIIGWLFKNKSFERTKNELLIFLTPRILAQQEETQASLAN